MKFRESLKYAYKLNGYNFQQNSTQKDLEAIVSDFI